MFFLVLLWHTHLDLALILSVPSALGAKGYFFDLFPNLIQIFRGLLVAFPNLLTNFLKMPKLRLDLFGKVIRREMIVMLNTRKLGFVPQLRPIISLSREVIHELSEEIRDKVFAGRCGPTFLRNVSSTIKKEFRAVW